MEEYIFIFHQAELFKKAYEILKIEYLRIIENSNKFDEYCLTNEFNLEYFRSLNLDVIIFIPMIVNGLFSIELYLKTLIKLEDFHDSRAHGHEIKKLYNSLNAFHRNNIQSILMKCEYDLSNFNHDLNLINKVLLSR